MKKPVRFKGLSLSLGDISEAYALGEQGRAPLEARDQNDQLIWRRELDACVAEGSKFMGRLGEIWVCGDLVLAQSYGEHWRGATAHHYKVHALNAKGQCVWHYRCQLAPRPYRLKQKILALESFPQGKSAPPYYQLIELSAQSGTLLSQEIISPPRLSQEMKYFGVQSRLKYTKKSKKLQIMIKGFIDDKKAYQWETERVYLG